MKTSVAFVVSLLALLCAAQPVRVHAQKAKAVQTIVTVLTGLGAAESLSRSGQSYEKYKQESAILSQLRNQGIDAKKSSIYSVYFSTSGGVWTDFWTFPDLFFVVDIEGQGTQLVPQIWYNYRGEPVLGTVVSETVRPGSRVVVRVLDDDTSSDVIWNSILKTRINWRIDAEVQSTGTKFVSLRANAKGQFTLLDRNVTIDAPDLIATTDFIVPETQDGLWVTETQLIDSSRKNIGKLLFSSLWSAPQELTKQQKEIEQQQEKVSTSFGKYIFWGVIGIFLLVWFGWSVISNLKTNSPSDKNT